MNATRRLRYLRVALVMVGLACLAFYPLIRIWPTGWIWHVGHSAYPLMIVGIYATLGVLLILAARDPYAHLSLIWFTVWSSIATGQLAGGVAKVIDRQLSASLNSRYGSH